MTQPSDTPEQKETLLLSYVKKALAMVEAGESVQPSELCREHPELADAVAETLCLRQNLPQLQEAARSTDPLSGKVLGERYRLDSRLGMGAMGLVYLATDLELRRSVAVKMLEARLFHEPIAEERFLREAEILAALRHDHVVSIYDRGRSEEGTMYLVMEHLQGASMATVLAGLVDQAALAQAAPEASSSSVGWLQKILEGEPPPEASMLRMAVRWTADLASGLQAAHERGVFHRDVKPSNVYVRRDCRAVLLDFGIAARAEDQKLTITKTVLGTPWYMAPEQAMGTAPPQPTTDIYGLTATLYHMLTLRPPFEGDQASVLVRLQTEDPPPAVKLRPGLPRDLQAILEKGMERDPRHRYQAMTELEADLRAFLEHRPVSVRPLSAVGRLWRRTRRAPARSLAVAASLAVVLLAGLLIPLWVSSSAAARKQKKEKLRAKVPALIAVEGQPGQRLVEDLAPERGQSIDLLSRILELDPKDLPVRLWRAALSLDQGDHAGAAGDLNLLAAQSESPYVAAVAQRYLSADPKTRGTEAVDLSDLPEPVSDQDYYVAGFHELRNRHIAGFAERAELWLSKAMMTYGAARDLRLIALLALTDSSTGKQKYAYFKEAYEEALWLEGRYGQKTARTCATRGAALLGMKRYEEAVKPLLKVLELRPDRHSPLHNLGVAHLRLGSLEKAEQYLEEALRLRPHFWNTTYTMAQVRRDQMQYDEAFRVASQVPKTGPGGVAWKRPFLLGDILQKKALLELVRGDPEEARTIAGQSVEHFDSALASAPKAMANLIKASRAVAVGVQSGSLESAAENLLNLLQADPLNATTINNLATLLPDHGLGRKATWILRLYLRRLAAALAPGDPKRQELIQKARQQDIRNRPK